MSVWRLIVVAFVLAGCRSAPASDSSPDMSAGFGPAEDVVKRFFGAAETGDCATLGKILVLPDAGTFTPEACEGITHDFSESKTHLLRIVESKVDGRDKSVVLVSTDVEFKKKKTGDVHQWVIRAEWRNGMWKVRF